MKFQELIRKHTFEEITPRMRELYFSEKNLDSHYINGDKLVKTMEDMAEYATDQLSGYEYVFNSLLTKRARYDKDKKVWTIFVRYFDKDYDGTPIECPYYDVYGENGDKNKDENDLMEFYKEKIENGTIEPEVMKTLESNVTYGLEFSSRSQWLGMSVDQESLDKCGEIDFIVYCLWEMTFAGFSETQIKSKLKTLNDRVKNIKEGKEKCIEFKNADDFMKEMDRIIAEGNIEKEKNKKKT